ncbi:MAG TPA: hypothetical protein VGR91_12760 [Stellaceae bacterium]|nr:hypothetical protein [Stellaceae bacterium]
MNSRILAVAVLLGLGIGIGAAGAGPAYKNGFPSDRGFFPLGVWLQAPRNAAEYKAIGINTFVGISGGAGEAGLAALASEGMFAAAMQDGAVLHAPDNHVIRAWLQEDEPDNAQPIGLGLYGTCIPAREVVRRTRAIAMRDPTRPVMINFGRGVADPQWRGRGLCGGDMRYYDVAAEGAGLLSFDIYPVSATSERVRGKLQYVARGVRRLVRLAKPGQSVWAIIETTALVAGRPVRPDQLSAEVWMALIAGARGIVYFVHEWVGGFREDAIFRHPDIVAEAARLDRRITALAPVLNSPSIEGKVAVSSSSPIAVMAKAGGDALYLFAAAMRDRPVKPRFTIRGAGDGEAVVIGEGRKVKLGAGSFTDSFAGFGVHLYRIALRRGND